MATHISRDMLRRQFIFWTVTLFLLCLFLFTFRSVLLPFLAGIAIAYFLDPVADWLETKGLSRLMATVSILVVFLLLFIFALILIVPELARQAFEFADSLPRYVSQLRDLMASLSVERLQLPEFLGLNSETLRGSVDDLLRQSTGVIRSILQGIWSGGSAVLDIIGLLVIAPVVAFYMLLDWDRMIEKIDDCIPRRNVDAVRQLGRDVNAAIAGFVRGQGTVCVILGLFYAIALTVAGLNFGLLIGLFAGLISFIPYVGSLIGLVLSIGVALVQFWPDAETVASTGYLPAFIDIGIVAGVFFAGQFLEGNFLQPKLVGESVNLHPVWLMFALFAFGSLFGFTGMLIAVPAAAAIGVLVRFAIAQYQDSDLYEDGLRALDEDNRDAAE
ncbi:MAG: AI-2E family transporter [Pseudomonadota bacterium]